MNIRTFIKEAQWHGEGFFSIADGRSTPDQGYLIPVEGTTKITSSLSLYELQLYYRDHFTTAFNNDHYIHVSKSGDYWTIRTHRHYEEIQSVNGHTPYDCGRKKWLTSITM